MITAEEIAKEIWEETKWVEDQEYFIEIVLGVMKKYNLHTVEDK